MSNHINFETDEKKNSNSIINKPNFNVTDFQKKTFEDIKKEWRNYCEFWITYPDIFIDFIKSNDCKIDLYFYQRIFLRIFLRYRRVFITATRGTAKSFTEILAMYLKCMFRPNIKLFICAYGKEQAAKIAQDNISDIWSYFPILKGEIKYKSFTKDYTKLVFHNGSRFDVVQVKDSTRGGRRNGGAIEEISNEKFNGDLLHSVVIPLMANNRLASCKGYDPNEIHKQEWYCTTAGTRQSFSFKKMKEIYADMLNGKSAFNIGCGYELPCMHEQLDINFINEQKESPTYNPLAFQREYESIWTGSSEDSLINLENLNKCRILTKPELKAEDKNAEYILAYDVARAEGSLNAQSVLVIIKTILKADSTFQKNVVNIFSFEGTHFLEQALFIKKMVNTYKARILCLDTNGLGVGLCDYLVTEIDENPAYEVINDDRYNKYKTEDSIPMIFSLKSQTKDTKSSDIHNVFIQYLNHQKVKLLKGESAVKSEILSKCKSNIEKYTDIIKPFIMTDILCDEIMNLEYKQSGVHTQVKQISKSINKDKFSALEYGLFWIYLQERKNLIKKEEKIDISKLFSYKKPEIRKKSLRRW